MDFEVISQEIENAKIKVVGVGGGGGNAVIHMINHNIEGVDFICANTDTQALSSADGAITLKLGNGLTKGLGAGADPEIGKRAAESDRTAIEELLSGADMIFITAGMGGGTGTGAAPVIASIAKELGALTVAVVTKPFRFEGKKRMGAAEKGLASLVEEVDSLVTIPNQKLYEILGEDTPMQEAFAKADDVLRGAVQGISDIIMKKGHINVDFADVKTVMSEKGIAMMGTGRASGKNRAEAAGTQAVRSELLEDINLKNARGVLVNITAKKPTVYYGGESLQKADAIIPRIGASNTFYGTAVVRQFETMNCFCVNSSVAISNSRDKLRSMQILAEKGINMPVTGFASHTKDIEGVIESVGSSPLVMKLLQGTQGQGIVLAETRKAAESVMSAFRQLDADIMVQEYIKVMILLQEQKQL